MFRRRLSSKERNPVSTAPLPRRNKNQSHFNANQQSSAVVVNSGDTETTSNSLQHSSNVHNLSFENECKKKRSNLVSEPRSSHPCYCCEECGLCNQTQVSSKRSRSSFVATIRKKFFSHKKSEKKNHDSFEMNGEELPFTASSHNRSLPRGWKSSQKQETLRLERSPSALRRNREESHKHKQANRNPLRASCATPDSLEKACICSHKNQRSSEDAQVCSVILNQNVEAIPVLADRANRSSFGTKSPRPNSFTRPPISLHVSKNSVPDVTGYGHASPPDVHLGDGFDEIEDGSSGALNTNSVLPYYDKVKNPNVPGWSLTGELLKLPSYGWYWGPMSRTEAEKKLSKLPDGSFLVRDSSDDRHLLSLSFRSDGRTLHTRIEHFNGMFSFYARSSSGCRDEDASSGAEAGCSSVVELIERSISDSQSGAFCYSRGRSVDSRSFPVCLSKPVSRFSSLATLQHMCRFVLRQRVRIDHLEMLPLPPSVKAWLEETQY